jgi:hypothetical protein
MANSSVKIAIFGGGRVGTAMSLEMPGVPIVHTTQVGFACDLACVCWPAHAMKDFKTKFDAKHIVSFCNGVWAREDGADEHGCCYVRAVKRGDRSPPGRKGWRVGSPRTADLLRSAGLGVVLSRSPIDHEAYVWGKSLYILPLAFACSELDVPAKQACHTEVWKHWFAFFRNLVIKNIGEEAATTQSRRASWLAERSPKGWRPSSSPEELKYFRCRLPTM